MLTNWAGNHAYAARDVLRPRTVDEVRVALAAAESAHAVGARHSFSAVGDTSGILISTEHLTAVGEPDGAGRVRVGAGVSYGVLAERLHAAGRALPNFASLPHLTVGGAIATATHGSGARNRSLASAACALELVLGDGTLLELERGEEDFDGAVVSLGALGVVTAVTLETVPPFELCQSVFEEVPWAAAEERLLATLELGYSTSLFLSWAGERIEQVWVKAPERLAGLEGRPVVEAPRHPIPGADPVHCTVQGDVPGPAHERLPHFRLEGIPSAGAELQSEYAVAREDAAACVRALRAVGGEIAPVLHISEIRAVAADDYWLSPFYGRDSVTFHFTWKAVPEAERAIAAVEGALAPWSPRPHWAKLFALDMAAVRGLYPRADAFVALRERLDPGGTFRNPFVDRLVAGAA